MLSLLILGLSLLLYILWTASCLVQNYQSAQTMDIPIVVSLVSPESRAWRIIQLLLPKKIMQVVPRPYMAKYKSHGGHYVDKYKMHLEFGKVFVHITPSGNAVHVADAAVSEQILVRRTEFLKPIRIMGSVDIFGKSLASVEGPDWQRHRRITAPPFNERNSALVWTESIRQASQMLEVWQEGSLLEQGGVNSVTNDTMTLGLHVLTSAGFGKPYEFRSAKEAATNGYQLNYRDCLAMILQNLFVLFITPEFVLKSRFAPKKMAKFRSAVMEYKRYMVEMVQDEKEQHREGRVSPNLLSVLVKHSEDAGSDLKITGKGLSDSEIYGNIFMYSLAGHESTANTIAFAVYLFVAFPEWQEWVAEEINLVFSQVQDGSVVEYEEYYPKLPRCLAVMYETLRLFPPVLSIPKTTGPSAASFEYQNRTIPVCANTSVHVNSAGIHLSPEYWGSDSLIWRPDRWITHDSETVPNTDTNTNEKPNQKETLNVPRNGTYIPWAEGPRICPGKKFAMVEFVAVIATLLRSWRVEVVCHVGESDHEARERVKNVVESAATRITLQMKEPERVRVRWVRR